MAEVLSRGTSQRHATKASAVERPSQLTLISGSQPTPEEIAREQTLGGAIELCAKVAGYSLDKSLTLDLEVDKAQLSRWQNGTEGIVWPKLLRLMDVCGNHAPVLWMMHRLGYDLHSFRRRESEIERELRLANERIDELERERVITINVLREVRA